MQIVISSSQADGVAAAYYQRGRPPLTKTASDRDIQNIETWLTSDKSERSDTEWKRAGLQTYLALALSAEVDIGPNCFPAEFICSDGQRRWPDKAIIKNCCLEGEIEVDPSAGDQNLLFKVTAHGARWLRSQEQV